MVLCIRSNGSGAKFPRTCGRPPSLPELTLQYANWHLISWVSPLLNCANFGSDELERWLPADFVLATKCRNGSRLWLAQRTIAIRAFATKGRVATRAQHHEPTPRWNRDCHRSPNRSSCQWELFLQKRFRYVLSFECDKRFSPYFVAHREDQLKIWHLEIYIYKHYLIWSLVFREALLAE